MKLMTVVNEPLLFMAVGFAGMLLSGWLFDRASERFFPDRQNAKAETTQVSKLSLRLIGNMILSLVVLIATFKSNIYIADSLLFIGCCAFTLAAYRVRLKPLARAGATARHLTLLVASLCVWVLPMAWFLHLSLVGIYGAH
jgi:hypothetical protein